MELKVLWRESTLVKNSFPWNGHGKSIRLPVCDFLVTSYSCRCSWYAVAPPQSFHDQNRLQALRSGSHSVFHVPRRAHPQSRGQDSPTYLTPIEHFMHGALGSGQALQGWARHGHCLKKVQSFRWQAKQPILWYVTLWSHVTGCLENRRGSLTLWGLRGFPSPL